MNLAMSSIKVFESEQFGSVRTVVKDGELWFVVADVCKALEIINPSDAIKRLDDERSRFNLGRQGESNIVNETGLYTLVLGSRRKKLGILSVGLRIR